jgi:hypothetical protein
MAADEYPNRFRRGELGSDLNENHDRRSDGDRHGGLQKDTKRAVIGVGSGVKRMNVRHLDDDQKRKQCQTHQRSHLQTLQPAAENAAEHCSKSVQR